MDAVNDNVTLITQKGKVPSGASEERRVGVKYPFSIL